MHVHKPSFTSNGWCVIIKESKSPISETIEVIPCSSREHAWSVYRTVQKERGKGL